MEFHVTELEIELLRAHEEHCTQHASTLMQQIEDAGFWIAPILVEAESHIILDGHHRARAAVLLRLRRVPCIMINYESAAIQVSSWRDDFAVHKATVLEAGRLGELMPKKTSRHKVSFVLPRVQVPLQHLRSMIGD